MSISHDSLSFLLCFMYSNKVLHISKFKPKQFLTIVGPLPAKVAVNKINYYRKHSNIFKNNYLTNRREKLHIRQTLSCPIWNFWWAQQVSLNKAWFPRIPGTPGWFSQKFLRHSQNSLRCYCCCKRSAIIELNESSWPRFSFDHLGWIFEKILETKCV